MPRSIRRHLRKTGPVLTFGALLPAGAAMGLNTSVSGPQATSDQLQVQVGLLGLTIFMFVVGVIVWLITAAGNNDPT